MDQRGCAPGVGRNRVRPPYGTAMKPTGNVLWVDPFTETTFLDTLSEIGIVELLVNEN